MTTRPPAPGSSPASAGSPGASVVIVANDATVKGGTYYPMTVKKHLRAQEIALQNRLPCIYLVDSGGAFLPLPGRGLPRPRALRAHLLQPGDDVGPRDPPDRRGDGLVHRGRRLRARHERRDGDRAQPGHDLPRRPAAREGGHRRGGHRRGARRWRAALPHVGRHRPSRRRRRPRPPDRPRHRRAPSRRVPVCPGSGRRSAIRPWTPSSCSASCPRTCASPTTRARSSPASSTARASTSSRSSTGRPWSRGFAHIHGHPVGILANNGILFSESALKGAHFIELCDQRRIPLVFLQNITGFMVGRDYEAGGIAKHGAKMVTAVVHRARAEADRDRRRVLRRRQLRDVRPRLLAAASCGCGRTRESA